MIVLRVNVITVEMLISFQKDFFKCTNCPHYNEIMKICTELDAIIEEKDNL